MASTQLDRIEAMLVTQGRKLDELVAIGRPTLIAAVAALNTATSQGATAVDGIGGINTALSGAITTLAGEGRQARRDPGAARQPAPERRRPAVDARLDRAGCRPRLAA